MRTVANAFSDVKRLVARFRETSPVPTPWRVIAREHYPGIPEARMAAWLCAIYKHEREPHANDIRRALGMAEYAPALVCAIHGIVHVSKRCPAERKPRAPRRQYKKLAALALTLAGLWASGHILVRR